MGKIKILISIFISFFALNAQSAIIDLADNPSGIGYFKDLETGFTWMDLDNFTYLNHSAVTSFIDGTGFEIATESEVLQLIGSIGSVTSTNFDDLYTIMGGGSDTTFEGEIFAIGGWYGPDALPTIHEGVFATKGPNSLGGLVSDWNWDLFVDTSVDPGPRSTTGTWVVNTSVSVPEPSVLALMGAGLVGLGLARRRAKKNKLT